MISIFQRNVSFQPDFLSISLSDGHVLAEMNQGSGRGQVISAQTFNDGKWHLVRVEKNEDKELIMTIDKEQRKIYTLIGHL